VYIVEIIPISTKIVNIVPIAVIMSIPPSRWTDAYNRFRPARHKRNPSTSRSRSRSRPDASLKPGLSYTGAATSNKSTRSDLDNSIHSPENRGRPRNNPQSQTRFRSQDSVIDESNNGMSSGYLDPSMNSMTGQALIDLNKKFDSFATLLKEMDDRLFTACNQIQNIDYRLCNIESHLNIDTATDRDLYFHTPKPDSQGAADDWEIELDDVVASRIASRRNNNNYKHNRTPTEIHLEGDEMNTDDSNPTHPHDHSLTALEETKSALRSAEAENNKLRADLATLQLIFVSMQNDISRLSSNTSQ